MSQPPPYPEGMNTATLLPSDSKAPYDTLQHTQIPQQQQSLQTSPQAHAQTISPFPQSFGFYQASFTSPTLHIALSKESPPLLYISTHHALSSQPSVILYSSSENAPLATADFHSFSNTIDLLLYNPSSTTSGSGPAFSSACKSGGIFSSSMIFNAPVSSSEIETFEWKGSSGPQVAALNGRSHGMKLVLQRTGEVVAVWTFPNAEYRKKGKMAFIADRSALGPLMEVASVISMAGIMEIRRRQKKSRHHTAGGASGGGVY